MGRREASLISASRVVGGKERKRHNERHVEENASKSVRFSEEQTTKTTGRIHVNMLRTPPKMRADTSQKKK